MRSISVAETAGEMGVSETLVRSLLQKGELSGYRAGRVIRVFTESVEDYQRRRAINPEEQAKPVRKKTERKSSSYWKAVRTLDSLLGS